MISFRLPIAILPEWKAAAEGKQMTASGFLVEALLKEIANANNDVRIAAAQIQQPQYSKEATLCENQI